MIYVLLVVFGLCLGSFVNALVWRLHKGRNWVSERSECVHCHHKLATRDLIPVISWLMLRGKCRYCHKPIDDTPLTELVTAALFLGSYAFWPYELNPLGWLMFALWLLLIVGFVAMSLYDLRWMTLPDKLTYVFSGVAVVLVLLMSIQDGDAGLLLSALGGVLSVGGLFYVLFQVSGGKWIGGGDVKLGFALGLLAGSFINGLLLVFLASLMGSLVAIPLLVAKKKKTNQRMPFGPFLMTATVIVFLFGNSIVDWYMNLLAI